MPDAAPIRTQDGSFIALTSFPVGPERLMRWIDRLATVGVGGSTADLLLAVAGRRGWTVLAELDRVDGKPVETRRIRYTSRREAESAVASLTAQARAGETTDDLLDHLQR